MNRNVALVSIMSSLFLAGKWITWHSNNQQIKNIFGIINLPKLYTHTRILTHLLLRQQLYTQSDILWDGIWEEPDRTFCQKKKKQQPKNTIFSGAWLRLALRRAQQTPAIICRLQPSTDKQISELSLLEQNHFTSKWYTFEKKKKK